VIINKQVDKISFTFNLNVEFSGNMTFNHKNPLTKQKIDCIIKSASETNLQTATQSLKRIRETVTYENRRVVYVCQRSNGKESGWTSRKTRNLLYSEG
jgi:hypothetical protein